MNSINPTVPFASAPRINQSLTAAHEKQLLEWLANHAPSWLTSDQLTTLGFAAQIAAGILYALARIHPAALLLVNVCIVLNWLGDSLDGTLARSRQQQRPRYGFYVDHMVDLFGSLALMAGLACSGFLHGLVAVALLLAFLLLAAESYLATYTLSRFELSQGVFGPTEIRLLLMLGNFALLHTCSIFLAGHQVLLFDVGGVVAATYMFAAVIATAVRHTAQLYREEPLP